MDKKTMPHELNTLDILQEINLKYWNGEISPERLYPVLRLSHAFITSYKEECSRCGGKEYAVRSQRARTVQCMRCRQIVSLREIEDIKRGIISVETLKMLGVENV